MTTLTVPLPCVPQTQLQPLTATSAATLARRHRVLVLAVGISIAALALGLRTWAMNATLATGDQVAMAYMVRHNYGFKWILAHNYGPVPAIVQRAWAELLCRLHVPVDEAAMRAPVALASLLTVLTSFALLRRMRLGRAEAMLAALLCAVMPTLVDDAHSTWGYLTFWLLSGVVSLWATLTWFDTRRPVWLVLTGAALLAHCLSNCFAFGLPVTLLVAWFMQTRAEHAINGESRRSVGMPFLLGFVMPCVVAIAIILAFWHWTGAGQLGRLLHKQEVGSSHPSLAHFLQLPGVWVQQFGYAFALMAAAGLIYGTYQRGPTRLIACWCCASLLPLMFLVDWQHVGYPSSYLIEVAFTGGLLAAVAAVAAYRRLSNRRIARAVLASVFALALLHMTVGAADACLRNGRLAALTGIRSSWGSVQPETGIKAAGWYVREYVPASAMVMATHTNVGMEAPVAEYYCGRGVLADYDLSPELIESLVRAMSPRVDVLIADADHAAMVERATGLQRVATFRADGRAVRFVYARPTLNLPILDASACDLNARYDRQYKSHRIPQPIVGPPQSDACLTEYQATLRALRLKTAH